MREFITLLVGCVFVFVSPVQANISIIPTSPTTETEQDTTMSLPKVFLLGDHEHQFEKLSNTVPSTLLAASGDDSNEAFATWLSMIKEMEAHAELVDYDLKGIKMWLYVFWDKDGTIDHLAYFLKPNSKNVDKVELTAFLKDFTNNYRFPLTHESKFSHYSGAAFPTLVWKKKSNAVAKQGN